MSRSGNISIINSAFDTLFIHSSVGEGVESDRTTTLLVHLSRLDRSLAGGAVEASSV
jgi:hypothetical protein